MCLSSLWVDGGGGRGKRRAKAAGVEGTGGRKAEGRRTVISGRRPCSQTRTGPWTVDLGEAVGQWAGQCSGSVAGKWVGVAPPESQAFQKPRRRAPPPLCLPPQVGSGPGWDGIGCPQALAPSRNPFVSERKGGSNVFERRRCGSGSRAVVQFARVSPASMLCLLICSQRATLCSTTVYLLRMYSGKGGPRKTALLNPTIKKRQNKCPKGCLGCLEPVQSTAVHRTAHALQACHAAPRDSSWK